MDTRSCPLCECWWCAAFGLLGVCPYCDLGLEDDSVEDGGEC